MICCFHFGYHVLFSPIFGLPFVDVDGYDFSLLVVFQSRILLLLLSFIVFFWLLCHVTYTVPCIVFFLFGEGHGNLNFDVSFFNCYVKNFESWFSLTILLSIWSLYLCHSFMLLPFYFLFTLLIVIPEYLESSILRIAFSFHDLFCGWLRFLYSMYSAWIEWSGQSVRELWCEEKSTRHAIHYRERSSFPSRQRTVHSTACIWHCCILV